LTLDQSAGTTAGSSPATGFDANFAPSAGDSVKDVTLVLPPGLLANANLAGGACLVSATPNAACQVGTGTLTDGGMAVPVTLFLVKGPAAADAAGLAVVQGSGASGPVLTTGDVTQRTTPTVGLNVAFSNLTAGISEMNLTLTALRLPTSCPSPAANVTVNADSQQAPTTSTTASAPLTVTGCSTLPYAPKLTAAITSTSAGGAGLTLGITQAATESANQSIVLELGKGITPNATADLPCLATTTGCQIGTATATSPLVPSPALANGTVTLAGPATTPTITVAFPGPLAVGLVGTVSLTSNSVTFSNVPDLPLTNLTLNITGPNGQKAFTTNCAPNSVVGNFTAQGGQTATSTAPIAFTGCVVAPKTSGSTSGLAAGKPKLKFKAAKGAGGNNISQVSIGLASGLKFSRSAIVTTKKCTTKKGKKSCTTTTKIKGLSISGGKAKTEVLKAGKLVITLQKAVGSVTVTTGGPFLTETKSLQTNVKKHKTKTLKFALKVTDAKHNSTSSTLSLKTH
jgi:hypothetical protein